MPIGLVPDFELAWTFMGRSFGYILFIGLAEIIGAFLLLFNKTKLIWNPYFNPNNGKHNCIRHFFS